MTVQKERILFLDLLRFVAVVMMVEGHTIDVLLAEEFKTADSSFFSAWSYFRGFTAPIFMFTSGVVFTYLLAKRNLPFNENPRVGKGIKRFVTLMIIGYLLHLPTLKFYALERVTEEQWRMFFNVDALQLIASGLLFVIAVYFIADKFNLNLQKLLLTATVLLLIFSPAASLINWTEIFPLPLAAYFYGGDLSFFPLFPWLGYVTAGAVLGVYLSKRRQMLAERKTLFLFLSIGFYLIVFSALIGVLKETVFANADWLWTSKITTFRVGVIFLLLSLLFGITFRVKTVPASIINYGTHTLSVYVLHLMILYGSVLSVGAKYFIGAKFTIAESVLSAIFMIILMGIFANLMTKIDKDCLIAQSKKAGSLFKSKILKKSYEKIN